MRYRPSVPRRPRRQPRPAQPREYDGPPAGPVEAEHPHGEATCDAHPGPGQLPEEGRVYGCSREPGHPGRHIADAVTGEGRLVDGGWTWPQETR